MGVFAFAGPPETVVAVSQYGNVYRRTAEQWSKISAVSFGYGGVEEVVGHPGWLVAIAGGCHDGFLLSRSRDRGATWTVVIGHAVSPAMCPPEDPFGGDFAFDVVASPLNETTVWIAEATSGSDGQGRVWRTDNGGVTWSLNNDPSAPANDVRHIALPPPGTHVVAQGYFGTMWSQPARRVVSHDQTAAGHHPAPAEPAVSIDGTDLQPPTAPLGNEADPRPTPQELVERPAPRRPDNLPTTLPVHQHEPAGNSKRHPIRQYSRAQDLPDNDLMDAAAVSHHNIAPPYTHLREPTPNHDLVSAGKHGRGLHVRRHRNPQHRSVRTPRPAREDERQQRDRAGDPSTTETHQYESTAGRCSGQPERHDHCRMIAGPGRNASCQ